MDHTKATVDALLIPFFNPYLMNQAISESEKKKKKRDGSFCDAEECLLALGIEQYGMTQMSKIVEQFLPTKTEAQLKNRWKNAIKDRKSKGRCPDKPNVLRSLNAVIHLPLANEEKELLLHGVRELQTNWIGIAQRYMPYRPQTVLKQAWKEITKVRVLGLNRCGCEGKGWIDFMHMRV